MTDDPLDEYWKQVLLIQNNQACYTQSGGAIYHGQYWGPFAQASSYTSGLPYLGPFAQQVANQAQLAYAQLAQQQPQYASLFATVAGPCRTEPLEDAGISAGEIIGHRAWRVNKGLLRSMAVNKVWAPGEPMEGDPQAGPDCGGYGIAGVHAFKTRSEVLTAYDETNPLIPIAFGTVALWGTVVEHELGYRAQFGRVNSIDLIRGPGPTRERWMRRRLRKRYGV